MWGPARLSLHKYFAHDRVLVTTAPQCHEVCRPADSPAAVGMRIARLFVVLKTSQPPYERTKNRRVLGLSLLCHFGCRPSDRQPALSAQLDIRQHPGHHHVQRLHQELRMVWFGPLPRWGHVQLRRRDRVDRCRRHSLLPRTYAQMCMGVCVLN